MTSSLKRRSLSKPRKGEKIHAYELGVVRARNKNKLHSFLLEAFEDSGMTKAELACMLGKQPAQITRWLSGPGNLTLDTVSDLLFAMCGKFVEIDCSDDLAKGRSNRQAPRWVLDLSPKLHWQQVEVPARSSKPLNKVKYFQVGPKKEEKYVGIGRSQGKEEVIKVS